MGSDLRVETLYKSRNEIMDKILNALKSWDKGLESGIDLIESNSINLDKIKEINNELSSILDSVDADEDYLGKLNMIVAEVGNLTDRLKSKKSMLLDGKNQLNKRNKVIDSYISNNNNPVFIDKDVE